MAEAAYIEDYLDGELPFDTLPRDAATIEAETLSVAVDGFEGPLDLLLTLARTQRVDLTRISVLKLAEQYLEFVEQARVLRIELAADYLVMAAWLAFLKSRLLLPKPAGGDEPSGEELAAALAFRLERLAAMRRAAAELMARDRLGRDFFVRGQPETVAVERQTAWSATLADLLRAYARVTTKAEYRPLSFDQREVLSVDAALERLRIVIGTTADWSRLAAFLPDAWRAEPERRRSAVASTFSAMLELAKLGEVEIRQETVFAPIFLRRRDGRSPG